MPRSTRVREHERTGPNGEPVEVREHERSLHDRDRRERIMDRVRIEHSARRREEDQCVSAALAEYYEQLDNGASHDDAVREAKRALHAALMDLDWEPTEADHERVETELVDLVEDARKRGLEEADSPAQPKTAARGARQASRDDDEEERLLSINDALGDDDHIVSVQELASDEESIEADGRAAPVSSRARGFARAIRQAGQEREAEEQLTLESQARGLARDVRRAGNALDEAGRRGLAKYQAREAERRARGEKVVEEARRLAQAKREEQEAQGPVGKPRKPGFGLPGSITTVPRRRVINPDAPPAAPTKGTGRLDE